MESELCVTFNSYANSLLLWFISNYRNIYGNEYLSHNVHNLLHLSSDVQIFGSLENFNCLKYENHMQKIKRKLHLCGKPLQEILNRVFEELQLPIRPHEIVQYPTIVYAKNNSVSYLQFKNYKIAVNNTDNCVLLDDNSIVFITDIIEDNYTLFTRAKHFLNPISFFTTPCDSKKLNIFLISNSTTSNIIQVPITRIKKKCLKINYFNVFDFYVTIPLICNEVQYI